MAELSLICDGTVDTTTGEYSRECAAFYLNMTTNDYSYLMGFSGSLFGFVLMITFIFAIMNTGKGWRL